MKCLADDNFSIPVSFAKEFERIKNEKIGEAKKIRKRGSFFSPFFSFSGEKMAKSQ